MYIYILSSLGIFKKNRAVPLNTVMKAPVKQFHIPLLPIKWTRNKSCSVPVQGWRPYIGPYKVVSQGTPLRLKCLAH